MGPSRFNLVTRSDLDGIVSAILLKEQDLIDDVRFVHPKDVQDGVIALGPGEITANLPYSEDVHLAFDHHISEVQRIGHRENAVIEPEAASAARVIYNYYGGPSGFPTISEEMMAAVDKADSADFTREEILDPSGWTLLSFLMDARTGLGRFHHFRIANYQLMKDLIDHCRKYPIDEVLALPDVKERVDLYREQQPLHRAQLERLAQREGPTVVLDLRGEEEIHVGNRFVIYALFPDAAVSMHIMWGKQQLNTVFAIGKSIFQRSFPLNIGSLLLKYGGGGHDGAGTCQVANDAAEATRKELLGHIAAAAPAKV